MTELLTAAQMRAIEQAAIDAGEVTGLALMERAGQGVVDAIHAEWPEFAPAAGGSSARVRAEREASLSRSPGYRENQRSNMLRVLVLCGPGNNGGDGFVVARLLAEAGWEVEVFLYGDALRLPPDARANYERWCAIGAVAVWDDAAIAERLDTGDFDLGIDAVFGTGLKRPLPRDMARTCHGVLSSVFSRVPSERRQRFVAIDLPSGICSDSGRDLGGAFPADLTVAFHRAKLGHYLTPELTPAGAPMLCGGVRTVDIGLKQRTAPDIVRHVIAPLHLAKEAGHKYSHGHVLVVSGGVGKGGAARLAARGALRVGAGAVTIGCPPAALIENAAQLNAVMLQRVADAAALKTLLDDARLNAVCIGPGLGLGAREAALVGAVCAHARCAVLDADALTLLAQDAALFAQLHAGCVLTPHAGEFARLFPDIAERLAAPATKGPAYSKVDATRAAAKRAGCVVLFKGPDTVIAHPDGRCSVNASVYDRAAPWLATAGSGDVLAGFITGLLALGFDPMQAAEAGAWLHTDCARSYGPGLIAEDLPEELPKVLCRLGIN